MASGFNINGSDVEDQYISKSYLLDRYPELANQFKYADLLGTGSNNNGILGNNGVGTSAGGTASTPVQTVSGGANWKSVSASSTTIGAIKTDGTLWMWGSGTYGGLADNTNGTSKSSPVQVVTGGTWKQISCRGNASTAIKTDGTLWGWGYEGNGELGNGIDNARYSSPIQTSSGGTNWKQVDMGSGFTMAVKTDGTLWGWGMNTVYQCGFNTTADRLVPTQNTYEGNGWKMVACGYEHALGCKTDGTLYGWGRNYYGQTGTGTNGNPITVPTQIAGTTWKQPSAGPSTSACIKTDGTLWVWGYNAFAVLATNNTTNYSSPVQISGGGTNWKIVDFRFSSVAAGGIKTDGTCWMWGGNWYGQRGNGTILPEFLTAASTPVQITAGGTNNWKKISVGQRSTHFIRDDSMDLGFDTL